MQLYFLDLCCSFTGTDMNDIKRQVGKLYEYENAKHAIAINVIRDITLPV